MNMNSLLDRGGIPLLIAAVSFFYAYRVLVNKDAAAVRGRDKKPLKDEDRDAYCREAGRILLIFGISALIMMVLSLYSAAIAFGGIVVSAALVIWLWYRLEEKYK